TVLHAGTAIDEVIGAAANWNRCRGGPKVQHTPVCICLSEIGPDVNSMHGPRTETNEIRARAAVAASKDQHFPAANIDTRARHVGMPSVGARVPDDWQ